MAVAAYNFLIVKPILDTLLRYSLYNYSCTIYRCKRGTPMPNTVINIS